MPTETGGRAVVLAVIGTAGRGSDAAKMNGALYDGMYAELLRAMGDFGASHLVSGGAAGGDHLAVRAFLEGRAERLSLRFPAAWDGGRFAPAPGSQPGTARTANVLHEAFARSCGVPSLRQIGMALAAGADASTHRGFLSRNLEVAREATHVLAFTFGHGREPADCGPDDPGFSSPLDAGAKDGGTAHTWGNAWRCEAKRHVPLDWLRDRLAAGPQAPRPT